MLLWYCKHSAAVVLQAQCCSDSDDNLPKVESVTCCSITLAVAALSLFMSTFQVKVVAQWRLRWQSDVVVADAAASVAAADARASNAIAERDEALSEYDSAREQADAAQKQAARVSADWRTAQRRWMLLLRTVSSNRLSIIPFIM